MEALQAPLPTGSERSPYQPIDSDAGEIRLVELLPGGHDDPIGLSLHTVKLEQRVTDEGSDENMSDLANSHQEKSDDEHWYEPALYCEFEYEALSYAWGKAISPQKVLLDGIELCVTESLDQGLRRLRFDGKPRMLWVDALCINQRDVEERSHQVQHMAMIYKSAESVLIWLGEWPNNAGCSHPDNCQALWLSLLLEKESEGSPDIPLHVFQHFVDIMELPWFRRLWVVQELALARRDPIVLIGSVSTTWSAFEGSVCDILFSKWNTTPNDRQLCHRFEDCTLNVKALADIRSCSGSHTSLYWCLIASQSAMSADPRDKVYGLLGLCDFQLTEAIAVDYSKPLRHVLAEATVVSILEECAYPYLDEDTQPTGIFHRTHWSNSSWLLDFTSIPKQADLDMVSNSQLDIQERDKRRGSIHLSMDHQTLYAHGRYVGTVCITQNSSWAIEPGDTGFRDLTPDVEMYDFYHSILKPRGILPRTLLQVLRLRDITDGDLDHFTSLLLGDRDAFRVDLPPLSSTPHGFHSIRDTRHFGGRDVFVTEEGHFGVSWYRDCRLVPDSAILVCLFGTEVPFILAPIPGTQSYEMINVAYVPGYGDEILDFPYADSESATWIDFAAEGGRQYAIV